MEHLPVEIIGNILSRLKAARDVVVASTTCKKWREALRTHLHSLSFDSMYCPVYNNLSTSRLEILITQTIFQTTGLQSLSILMKDEHEFSAASVIAWLLYTKETLRELCYGISTTPNINIIETCSRNKLEVLVLVNSSIAGIEPSYQKFSCLKSLVLNYVAISALDLNLLLTACPKIETLTLYCLDLDEFEMTMEVTSSSLKNIDIEILTLDNFTLKVDNLEKLELKYSSFTLFELVGKGSLRNLKMIDVFVTHLDIGENTANLEFVDASEFEFPIPKFYNMISRSSKLVRLRLWCIKFDDKDDVLDLDTMPVCFPQLTHLSLNYDLGDEVIHHGSHGSYQFNYVVVLELGWSVINDLFIDWVAGLLTRCPNLRKLVIHGVVSQAKAHYECQTLANVTSAIFRLMRKYVNVEVQFEYA